MKKLSENEWSRTLYAAVQKLARALKQNRLSACILIGTAALSLLSFGSSFLENPIQNGYEILRNAPGGAVKEVEILADDGEERIPVRIQIAPKAWSGQEAETAFEEVMEELGAHILGENAALGEIRTNLAFPSALPGHPGIRIRFLESGDGLILPDGTVQNLDLSGAVDTRLQVELSAGDRRAAYEIPVTVLPKEISVPLERGQQMQNEIQKKEEEQRTLPTVQLPDQIGGHTIHYAPVPGTGWRGILLLGGLAFGLSLFRPRELRKQEARQREESLKADYAELLSKLIVYMGAGLSARNAWLRIVQRAAEDPDRCDSKVRCRPLYQEMETTAGELQNGVPERRAYQSFAYRCGPKCYRKLAAILDQNLKNGDDRLRSALQLEMQEAFEERKNLARRRGEEAGTKLMLPLMLSLMTVLMITAVPALLALSG